MNNKEAVAVLTFFFCLFLCGVTKTAGEVMADSIVVCAIKGRWEVSVATDMTIAELKASMEKLSGVARDRHIFQALYRVGQQRRLSDALDDTACVQQIMNEYGTGIFTIKLKN